jgi:Glycosyltransferase 61
MFHLGMNKMNNDDTLSSSSSSPVPPLAASHQQRSNRKSCDNTAVKKASRVVFDPFTDITFEALLAPSSSNSSTGPDPRPPPPEALDQETNSSFSTGGGRQLQQLQHNDDWFWSSSHCVGSGTLDEALQTERGSTQHGRRPNFVSRTCWYKNLYYKVADQTFHYFASPQESLVRTEAQAAGNESAAELFSRMDVSMGHVPEDFDPSQLGRFRIEPWQPIVHTLPEVPPTTQTSRINHNAFVLLYHSFHSMNVGHFVFDDLLSLFSMMDLFLDSDTMSKVQHIPFMVELSNGVGQSNYGGSDPMWRCSPANHLKWQHCVKTYRRFFPALFNIQTDACSGDIMRTGNWLLGPEKIGTWPHHPKEPCTFSGGGAESWLNTSSPAQSSQHTPANLPPANVEYILLPNVMAGTGRLGQFGCGTDCSVGRGSQYWRFRAFLLRQLHVCVEDPPAGYITFSLPNGSSRPDKVYFFEQEIAAAQQRYGPDLVRVVDMANLTMAEQAVLVRNTAVLITNHGGGSFVALFLPVGAGVLNFWHDGRKHDHMFFESAGFFRTTWVTVAERSFVNRTMALIDQEREKMVGFTGQSIR